jgi:arginyl-tRNA synthetase
LSLNHHHVEFSYTRQRFSGGVAFAFRLAHAISSAWETVMVKDKADVEGTSARMWPWQAIEVIG